jgi:Holliday junction resolvase RusA-like endonuclease
VTRERLPDRRANEPQEFNRDGVRMTLTVGYKQNGAIGEIFLNCRPANSMLDVLLSDAAIIASLALHGVPLQQLAHSIKRDAFGIASSPIGAALDRISPPEVPVMKPITISLSGPPQGKGRARAFLRGGHIGHYTPEKTRSYAGMIRTAAIEALGDRLPFDMPVSFTLRAVFPVPASWSRRKQQQAIVGELKPGKKPDLDNIAKAWNDALNGVVYRDDALIVRSILEKRYGPAGLVVVTVEAAI